MKNSHSAPGFEVDAKASPAEADQPLVSILLPSLRPQAVAKRVLEFETTNPNCNYEIIVVSPFSIVAPRVVHVLEEQPQGAIGACRLALEHAKGDLIFYWSDDCSPTTDCLQTMAGFVRAHRSPFIGSFRILNGSGSEAAQWQAYDQLYACWGCLSRATLHEVGGFFDPIFRNYWADPDLSMRAWATAPSQRSVPTLSMPSCLLRTTSLPVSM